MQTLRVLVADDYEVFRGYLITYLLEHQGYDVIGEAKDGREAVTLTQILHPDVILLDINMPKVGGIEAAKLIKQHSPSTKIVFVTIHDEEIYHVITKQLDVAGFICKATLKQDMMRVLNKIRTVSGEEPNDGGQSEDS